MPRKKGGCNQCKGKGKKKPKGKVRGGALSSKLSRNMDTSLQTPFSLIEPNLLSINKSSVRIR